MVRRPLAYEKNAVSFKKHISLTSNFRDRETETWIRYKDGRYMPRVLESHMFSKYDWSIPSHGISSFVRVRYDRLMSSKWYKGKKRADREGSKLMRKLLHMMTDYMIDDMIKSKNRLKVTCRNRLGKYRNTGVLGVYKNGERPKIAFKWRWRNYLNKKLTPSINFSRATIDLINVEHYKGSGYANLYVQRSLTKDKRFNRSR